MPAKRNTLTRDPPFLWQTCFPVSHQSIGMKKYVFACRILQIKPGATNGSSASSARHAIQMDRNL
jgi:hypothetical protein